MALSAKKKQTSLDLATKAKKKTASKKVAKKKMANKKLAKERVSKKSTETIKDGNEVIKFDNLKVIPKANKSINLFASEGIVLSNLSEENAMTLVNKYSNESGLSYFKLGGILSTMQSEGWFMNKGFDKFQHYVEQDVGIHYRRAMYFIKIYNNLLESGIDFEIVSKIGWAKLKDLVEILTPDNVDEWVEKANAMNVFSLQEAIKQFTKGDSVDERTPSEKSELTTLSFKLFEDQHEVVTEALEKAKHEQGTESKAVALENICMGYLSEAVGVAPSKSIETLITEQGYEHILQLIANIFPDLIINVDFKE